VLVDAGGPGVKRLQGHEEFGIEEAGRIGSVVRPAVLGHDGYDLGVALDDPPHSVDVAVRLLEGNRGWKRRAYPQVSFLQLGQKLETKCGQSERRQPEQQSGAAEGDNSVRQSKF